jgi:hypothetical protein
VVTPLNGGTYIYCYLDNTATATFDVSGNELSSSLIPKSQVMRYVEVSSFYLTDRVSLPQKLVKGDQYKSFLYLDGKDKKYVILNDVAENEANIKKGRLTTVRSLGECDGFYYMLEEKNDLPARNFMFGKPENDDTHNMAIFTVSDYDREKNLFVTIKVEKKGKHKTARLVWLTP